MAAKWEDQGQSPNEPTQSAGRGGVSAKGWIAMLLIAGLVYAIVQINIASEDIRRATNNPPSIEWIEPGDPVCDGELGPDGIEVTCRHAN